MGQFFFEATESPIIRHCCSLWNIVSYLISVLMHLYEKVGEFVTTSMYFSDLGIWQSQFYLVLFQNDYRWICCFLSTWNTEIIKTLEAFPYKPLHWRHNGHDSVSNHQPHDYLLNRLFRRRSKKTSKLPVTGLCAGNSPGPGELPAQMASNAENVSIWWRHHAPCLISIYISILIGALLFSYWDKLSCKMHFRGVF